MTRPTRRELLLAASGLALAPEMQAAVPAAQRRPRVAAIATAYYWLSHTDVIVGRLLDGYSPNGIRRPPRTDVVSLYVEQVTERDMSREVAGRHGIRIAASIAEALTLGGSRLAVDAVVLIGEHGDYPLNAAGQKLYPRAEMFREIAAVYRSSGRAIPTFVDKHLSYDWNKAAGVWREVRALGIPLMAGSSVPVTVRRPATNIPLGARITEAVVTNYGELEAYGFHALEALQASVERRRGGETGVANVEMIRGPAVWRWRAGPGAWSAPLLSSALARHPRLTPGPIEEVVRDPAVFVVGYRDGLRAAVYTLNGLVVGHAIAAHGPADSTPWSTYFVEGGPPYAPEEGGTRPLPNFDGLVRCIEEFFVRRRPLWPPERTLLTTGILAHLFQAGPTGGMVETPALAIAYQPTDETFFQDR